MESVILTILGQILDLPAENTNAEKLTPAHIKSWDSLAHLSIITSLEEELGISFDPDEITDMLEGYDKILELVRSKAGRPI